VAQTRVDQSTRYNLGIGLKEARSVKKRRFVTRNLLSFVFALQEIYIYTSNYTLNSSLNSVINTVIDLSRRAKYSVQNVPCVQGFLL